MKIIAALPVLFAFLVGALPAHAWTWPVTGPVLRPFHLGSDPYAAGQHRGIDIGAPSGASVHAPAAGLVSFAGTVPRNGKTLTIETADGYAVTLVHLGSTTVADGTRIGEGATVGTIGPSGEPEHPAGYVHLGVRLAADPHGYVDPLSLLPAIQAPRDPAADPGAEEQPERPAEEEPAPEPAAEEDTPADQAHGEPNVEMPAPTAPGATEGTQDPAPAEATPDTPSVTEPTPTADVVVPTPTGEEHADTGEPSVVVPAHSAPSEAEPAPTPEVLVPAPAGEEPTDTGKPPGEPGVVVPAPSAPLQTEPIPTPEVVVPAPSAPSQTEPAPTPEVLVPVPAGEEPTNTGSPPAEPGVLVPAPSGPSETEPTPTPDVLVPVPAGEEPTDTGKPPAEPGVVTPAPNAPSETEPPPTPEVLVPTQGGEEHAGSGSPPGEPSEVLEEIPTTQEGGRRPSPGSLPLVARPTSDEQLVVPVEGARPRPARLKQASSNTHGAPTEAGGTGREQRAASTEAVVTEADTASGEHVAADGVSRDLKAESLAWAIVAAALAGLAAVGLCHRRRRRIRSALTERPSAFLVRADEDPNASPHAFDETPATPLDGWLEALLSASPQCSAGVGSRGRLSGASSCRARRPQARAARPSGRRGAARTIAMRH